jgi:hypothetical protein
MTLKKREDTVNWSTNHTLWRTRFGRCYGPVVRQTTEWMNPRRNNSMMLFQVKEIWIRWKWESIFQIFLTLHPTWVTRRKCRFAPIRYLEYWRNACDWRFIDFPLVQGHTGNWLSHSLLGIIDELGRKSACSLYQLHNIFLRVAAITQI